MNLSDAQAFYVGPRGPATLVRIERKKTPICFHCEIVSGAKANSFRKKKKCF